MQCIIKCFDMPRLRINTNSLFKFPNTCHARLVHIVDVEWADSFLGSISIVSIPTVSRRGSHDQSKGEGWWWLGREV